MQRRCGRAMGLPTGRARATIASRENRAGCARERNPCPGPGIDVEQLVTAVTHVILEFEFREAGKSDRGEKPLRSLFDGPLLDRFHEGAGDAELDGVLAPASPPRGDGGS